LYVQITLINEGRDSTVKHDIHTVKRAINGDARAFKKLLFLEEKMLYYKVLSYVVKREEALDVIQETSCKAFLSIGQLQNPKYFSTWLFRILIRECYKLLKKRDQIIPYEENELLKRLDSEQEKEIESFH
jgi:DNA-directed RNA polymerase specialized sigma24 family protein